MRQTSVDVRLVQLVLDTTHELGWWRGDCAVAAPGLTDMLLEHLANSRCLLKSLAELSDRQSSDARLMPAARKSLRNWLSGGVSLQLAWPRDWSKSIERWIGPRFYLSTAANFSSRSRFASIACSQIGRHGCKLRSWPKLLDAALQHFHRHHDRPLLIDGTTLSQPVEQFVDRTPIQPLHVGIDKHSSTTEWLHEFLDQVQSTDQLSRVEELAQELTETLRISPALAEPELRLAALPLQDRLAIALADHVMVLSVRERGTISSLIAERLGDSAFPVASVFVSAISSDSHATPLVFQQWLPRGAVGWLIAESPRGSSSRVDSSFDHCGRSHDRVANIAPRLLASSLNCTWITGGAARVSDISELKFLVHCTRGNSGPLPDESGGNYLDRAWTLGELAESHPLLTLQQIVSDERIVGNTRLTRTAQPCISFSAVPLTELLQRRRFRSHLGRWDWEPFGVLIRQSALAALGARPVIYDSADRYEGLSAEDRPYFQPVGKRDKRTGLDWSSEQEWRLLGHLSLDQLPAEAVLLFVEYQQQAEQLARYSRWNVVWCKPS